MDKKKPKVIEVDRFMWQVPQCCREGWDSCPHMVRLPREKKKNIAL